MPRKLGIVYIHIHKIVYIYIYIYIYIIGGLSFAQDTVVICTIDVVGLYPHIPHCEGLETLRKATEKGNPKVPVENLYNLAKLVLENNYF